MIKKEVGFGLDNFSKPKVLSRKDSIVQILKNILFLKPGQLPSLPFVGIDIMRYVIPTIDDGDLQLIGDRIVEQCTMLAPHIDFSGVIVKSITYEERPVVLIIVPISVDDESESLLMGVSKDTNGRVLFNYEFDDSFIK